MGKLLYAWRAFNSPEIHYDRFTLTYEIGKRVFVSVYIHKIFFRGFISGGRLYAPASFFQNYVTGITYKFDKTDGINLKKIENGKDKDGNKTYIPLGFNLKPNYAIPVIPEESISK